MLFLKHVGGDERERGGDGPGGGKRVDVSEWRD
jgi:hypothetical protein